MLEAQNMLTDIVAPRADVIGMGTWGRKDFSKKKKSTKFWMKVNYWKKENFKDKNNNA